MRDDDRTMSVHRAVASKSDDERRLLQECRGMSDDERKAFSSKRVQKVAYLSVTRRSLA